ncbi:MAG: DnaJ domain-containing protein [Holophagales bacterium]|nr:DnaJ domain-containing protein [Holophagales bacterium]MBK9964964.1 DnaJ domain-containing protein [Holophagales bacterium]
MTIALPRIRLAPDGEGGPEAEVPLEFDFDSPYDVLGVPRDASPEEAREAAFALSRVFERRARQGDAAAGERLARVNRAMETLTKPEKRREHDQTPGAAFLAIEDPAPIERVGWSDGLRLISERTLGHDPLDELRREGTLRGPRPDPLLDELLRTLGGGTEG